MNVEIVTKNQIKKIIDEEIKKKERFYTQSIEKIWYRLMRLEEEVKVRTGEVKFKFKNEK